MKILLAVDNSPFSKAATNEVLTEFRPADTEVHVLSVVDTAKLLPPMDGYGVHAMFVEEVSAIMEQWRNEAKQVVANSIKKLASAGFKAREVVMEGEVKACILEYAEDWKPDLIVLGSHSRKGFERLLLGSVSDAILRHANCSVRIVRVAARAKEGSMSQGKKGDLAHSAAAEAAASLTSAKAS